MNQEEAEEYMQHAHITGQTSDNATKSGMSYYLQEKEKGLAEAQLEVDSIKNEIYHHLKQDRYVEVEPGRFEWQEIKNESERTLSDWGIDRIMRLIHFYINKNNLLTNFDEEQINRLTLKFIRELNALILLKYQDLFREHTFEECQKIIIDKLEHEKKTILFNKEFSGIENIDKEEIRNEYLENIKKNLEKEMIKIKTQKKKEKIRDYGLMIAELEVVVFATLNRAYRGEERGSLRRHMNVSELIGNKPSAIPQDKGGFLSWGRR